MTHSQICFGYGLVYPVPSVLFTDLTPTRYKLFCTEIKKNTWVVLENLAICLNTNCYKICQRM
jgi:hypothetical protein